MSAALNETVYQALRAAMTDLGHQPGNVWPVYQPKGGLPAIIWRRVGEESLEALDGDVVLWVRIEIDVRSKDYSDTLAIDSAVRDRLRKTNRLVGTDPASDLPEGDLDRSRVFRRIRTYLLTP